jgi:hypothetical protein
MPDKLIKEGMKQPDHIKITFEKGTKDVTGHAVPNQAQFGPKYFLAFMLPDFKSKILTQLSEAKKEDGLTLFNLMGQCLQDIGLTEWTNVVAMQCPQKMERTKDNFDECIRYYLKAVAMFLNVRYQLIPSLCITKKPAFMLMHKFMQRVGILNDGYIRKVPLPQAPRIQHASQSPVETAQNVQVHFGSKVRHV